MTHVVSAKALSKAPGTSIKVKDALGSKSHLPQTPDPRPRCHLTGVASEGSLGPAGDSVFCLARGSALLDMPSSWLQWLGARQTSRGQVGRGSSQLCLYWCRQGRGVQRTRQSCVLNLVALCAQPLWVLLGVILCDRLLWGDTYLLLMVSG